MKTPFFLAAGAFLCLLLTSCITDSVNPLSYPDNAHADPRLLGVWLDSKDDETFHFSSRGSAWMHVAIVETKTGKKSDSYDFFPTVIGANTFLNVVMTGKDDQGHPTKGYIFVRYIISGDHVLRMWRMSQDAAAAAVRAGKLKGIVHEDKNAMMVGTPPRRDVDVTLQDSSANLVKFIEGSDVEALFSDKMEPLVRSKPAADRPPLRFRN